VIGTLGRAFSGGLSRRHGLSRGSLQLPYLFGELHDLLALLGELGHALGQLRQHFGLILTFVRHEPAA
jgi:hypothetical protein